MSQNVNSFADNSRLDELVFQDRNKEYGAYDIRKSYRPNLTKAFFIGIVAVTLAVIAPLVYMKVQAARGVEETKVEVQLDEILEPPPPAMQEEEPPPPPPKQEEPEEKVEIVKDLIPEPKPNPPVEEPPKTIEEVQDTKTGVVNQEGEKVKAYTPPPPPPVSGAGKNVEAKIPDNEIVEHVDQKAYFTDGGLSGFRKEFQGEFDPYSVDGEGTLRCTVRFVVEKNGTISQITVRGKNESFNEEVKRAVESINGKWRPGKKNNQEVRSYFEMPVTMKFEF